MVNRKHGSALSRFYHHHHHLESMNQDTMANSATANDWSPSSWRSKPVVQDVVYPTQPNHVEAVDPVAWKRKQGLEQVVEKLETLPPLVSAVEVSSHCRERCGGNERG